MAYAADPYVSSDGMAGWGFLRAALDSSLIGKIHLISNENSISSCKKAVQINDSEKIIYHSVKNSRFFINFENKHFGIIARIRYVDWIYQVRKYLHSNIFDFTQIDIVHHVTLATEIYPTIFKGIAGGSKKIIGPVGSSGNIRIFLAKPRSIFTFLEFLKQITRNTVSKLRLKQISEEVDLFIGNNLITTNIVNTMEKCNAIYFPNQIVPSDQFKVKLNKHNKFDALIVGQITPGKRPDLAIDFLSKNEFKSLSIGILGAGHGGFKKRLIKLISSRNMTHRVSFLGNLSREQVLSIMRNAKFLIHFSGREGASYVVGEAINMGLPVLCLNGTGAADILNLFPSQGVSLSVSELDKIAPKEILKRLSNIKVQPINHWTFERVTGFLEEIYTCKTVKRGKPN